MAESVAEAKARVDRVIGWVHRIVEAPGADAVVEQITLMLTNESLSPDERRTVMSLVRYELTRQADMRKLRERPHRRAVALLRSYLNAEQCHSLRTCCYFHVQGSAGGMYRLCMRTGVVQRVERRGRRWYWTATFCWHDYAEDASDKKRLPLPDLALQQMLWLRSDEPAFLANANLSFESRRIRLEPWVVEVRRLTEARTRAAPPEPRADRPRLVLGRDGEWEAVAG